MKYKPIAIEEASCLKASTSPLRVAIAQPLGDLRVTEDLGPHYEQEQIEDACRKVNEFFKIVRETGSELAIAPECFLPLPIIHETLADASKLRKDTLYILPMEMLRYRDFEFLFEQIRKDQSWKCHLAAMENAKNLEAKWVNAALILYIGESDKICLIQLKTKPARIETENMLRGDEVLSIEGQNGVLAVAMCADVNAPLSPIWSEVARRKPFSYTVHCQWNPKPDFEDYYTTFWSSLLNDEGGDNRIIFSVNWCRGSRIIGDSGSETLNRQSNRFIRGCAMQQGHIYRQRSLTGLHLQQRPASENPKKRWEIWYCMSSTDSVRVMDFVRPRQGVPDAQANRVKGVLSTTFWERDASGQLVNVTPGNLASSYFCQLRKEAATTTTIEELFGPASLCEIEAFDSACNMEFAARWLEEDADARIPTAFILCRDPQMSCEGGNGQEPCPQRGKTCSQQRQQLEDQSISVSLCLDVVSKLRDNEINVRLDVTTAYPTNLENATSGLRGWVLHGQGWPQKKVGRRIREILRRSKTRDHLKVMELYRIDGGITLKDIADVPVDICNVGVGTQEDTFGSHDLPIIHIFGVGV